MTPSISSSVLLGDCVEVMRNLRAGSVDFVLTDPPYLVNYRSRDGQSIANDVDDQWLEPAFAEIHRLMKPDALCVSFYGWTNADRFIGAWRKAGLRIVGHFVFRKRYASSVRYVRYQHEQAYLLAKGKPALPDAPISDVVEWVYTGNRLHPTEKPVQALTPLIGAFTKPGDLVLDPFCGSGSTLAAANQLGRSGLGIELDTVHHATASRRMKLAA